VIRSGRRWIRRAARPVRAPRPAGDGSVARLDEELLARLEGGFLRAARRAGRWLLCGPGCGDCCSGPFPITRLDARRLREGWLDLAASRPERAAAIRRRARRAVSALRERYPGDPATGRPGDDARALDRLLEAHAALRCPALDPRSERCELYAARPVACRTYGPPLSFGGEPVPPCPLCFRGADAATVERCRYAPDATGLEEAILARMGVAPGREWETLIAFVLSGDYR
jgi:Fe-S-cluster containining protein